MPFGPTVLDPPTNAMLAMEIRVVKTSMGTAPVWCQHLHFSFIDMVSSMMSGDSPLYRPYQPSRFLVRFNVPNRVVSVGPTLAW